MKKLIMSCLGVAIFASQNCAQATEFLYKPPNLEFEDYKVPEKSASFGSYDPVFGNISFSETDISIPGNSGLKVQLVRKLTTGHPFDGKGSANGAFGRNKIYLDSSSESGLFYYNASGWTLDIPHIYATTVKALDNTFFDGQGWSTGFTCSEEHTDINLGRGYKLDATSYWQGVHLHIPGETSEVFVRRNFPGSDMTPESDYHNVRVTDSNWTYDKRECLPGRISSDGSVFQPVQVKSPDGRIFTFGHMVDYQSGKRKDSLIFRSQMVRRVLYVTKVEDHFGNFVEYNYTDDDQLLSIEAKDGRRIDLDYSQPDESGERRLESARAGGRKWSYELGSKGLIDKVVLPNKDEKQYKYQDIYWANSLEGVEKAAHTEVVDGVSTDYVYGECRIIERDAKKHPKFTYIDPDGVTFEYNFDKKLFGIYNARDKARTQDFTVSAGPVSVTRVTSTPTATNCKIGYVLTSSAVSGAGFESVRNSYEYSENKGTYDADSPGESELRSVYGDEIFLNLETLGISNIPEVVKSKGDEYLAKVRVTKVTDNQNVTVHFIDRDTYSPSQNKVIATDVYDLRGNLLSRDESEYGVGFEVGEAVLSGFPKIQNPVQEHHRIDLKKSVISIFNGGTPDKYTTVNYYQTGNYVGELTHVIENNNFSQRTKKTRYSYIHDYDFNNLSLLTKTEVDTGDGYTTVSGTTYSKKLAVNQLLKSYSFESNFSSSNISDWQQRFEYYPNGQLKTVYFNQLLRGADGETVGGSFPYRYVSYSDYYRGKPRVVTIPNRYDGTKHYSSLSEVDYFGNITKYTDYMGKITEYEFDQLNRIKLVDNQSPLLSDTVFSWSVDALDQPVMTKKICSDPQCSREFNREVTTYDGLLRPLLVESVGGDESRFINYQYNATGNLEFLSLSSTDYNESAGVYMEYDALDRQTAKTSGGIRTSTEYHPGNKVIAVDGEGNRTSTQYLAYGKPEQDFFYRISYPGGGHITAHYDARGNRTRVSKTGEFAEYGNVTMSEVYSYDRFGRLCVKSRPETGAEFYLYNKLGEMEAVSKGHEHSSSYSCPTDLQGNINLSTMDYDNLGDALQISHFDEAGTELDYSHHITLTPMGQHSEIRTISSVDSSVLMTYDYDDVGRLLSQTREFDGETLQVGYQYDQLSNIESTTYPSGLVVENEFNGFSEITKVFNDDSVFASDVSYYPTGTIKEFTFGNGIVHRVELDELRQLPSSISDIGKQPIQYKHYTYDNNLNIKSLTDDVFPELSLSELIYDELDQLIEVKGSGKVSAKLSYDDFSNILTYKVGEEAEKKYKYYWGYSSNNGTLMNVPNVGYFQYDSRGNVKSKSNQTFSYDSAGRMVESKMWGDESTKIRYIYDFNGRRIRKSGNGTRADSYYDDGGTLLYHKEDGATTSYVYLADKLIAKEVVQDEEDDTVSDANEPTYYTAFGEQRGLKLGARGYTGHVQDDELGLVYMQARYYDPAIGRFYSNDPVGYTDKNPIMSFNRYLYVNNNPYKHTDPNGEFLHIAVGAAIGAVVGAATEVASQMATGGVKDWSKVAISSATGAVVGGATAALPVAGSLGTTGGVLQAAANKFASEVVGAVGSATSSLISDGVAGNHAGSFERAGQAALTSIISPGKAVTGGAMKALGRSEIVSDMRAMAGRGMEIIEKTTMNVVGNAINKGITDRHKERKKEEKNE